MPGKMMGFIELSADIEKEDREMVAQYNEGASEDDLQDNNEGWLRKLAYKLIHSTTLLLPAWHKILLDQSMSPTNMPRDVSTRWNSTYNMLEYAVLHRKAIIDAIT
ncbi:hypothetical protein P692DRAFT_20880786 [Suillus brevipes Sb2]|nr:hypothetical protein P692DRAFT_20880786 [Suillus brevipes Sb2]